MKYLQDNIDKSVGSKFLYMNVVKHRANISLDSQLAGKKHIMPIYNQLTSKLRNPMTYVVNFFCK